MTRARSARYKTQAVTRGLMVTNRTEELEEEPSSNSIQNLFEACQIWPRTRARMLLGSRFLGPAVRHKRVLITILFSSQDVSIILVIHAKDCSKELDRCPRELWVKARKCWRGEHQDLYSTTTSDGDGDELSGVHIGKSHCARKLSRSCVTRALGFLQVFAIRLFCRHHRRRLWCAVVLYLSNRVCG